MLNQGDETLPDTPTTNLYLGNPTETQNTHEKTPLKNVSYATTAPENIVPD